MRFSDAHTPGFETCPECLGLGYGQGEQDSEFAKHHASVHRGAVADYTWLAVGAQVILHDKGFGDSRSSGHSIQGLPAIISHGYMKDAGVLVRLQSGLTTWVHPSECEPAIPDWRQGRLLVTGSRNWKDVGALRAGLDQVIATLGHQDPVTLVSGACPTGADMLAEQYWAEKGWPVERHPADWENHGKRAAYLRNALMTRLGAGACAAFPLGRSVGTRMTMKLAGKAGIAVYAPEGLAGSVSLATSPGEM